MPKFVDHTGRRYGRLTVISRAHDYRPGMPQWLCRCDCGTEKVVRAQGFVGGGTVSCGCYMRELNRHLLIERTQTHGMTKTPTHRVWMLMRQRCNDTNFPGYAKYGAKGVKVCKRWDSFESFLADVGERPSLKHSIERKNPRGDYEPSNCVWATMKEQQNNRTNNRRITFRGETLTLQQWSERLGTSHKTIAHRLERLGWPLDQALTLKPSPRRRSARPIP